MDNSVFVNQIGDASLEALQLLAKLEFLLDRQWDNPTDVNGNIVGGAGYEGIWNDGVLGANDPPSGTTVTQSQMNNAISGLKALRDAIQSNTGKIATLSTYSPNLTT